MKYMRSVILFLSFLLILTYPLEAQDINDVSCVECNITADNPASFRPYYIISAYGGMSHTRGESEFSTLLSPAAQLSATYRFHHAMGVRFGFGGWQGKGAAFLANDAAYNVYAFQFAQLNADYILDLAGVFGGFNHKRVVSPYLLAGVGAGYGFNNEQAVAYKEELEYYWDNKFFAPIGRAGLGIDFRLRECVSLGIEGNTNILTDKFNSKKADNVDWQYNVLAGISFYFGKPKLSHKSSAYTLDDSLYTPTQGKEDLEIGSDVETSDEKKNNDIKIELYSNQADVDYNIPLISVNNENTFAVIIANEKYKRVDDVIFAHNDGRVIKKYFNRTLGIPDENIHLVEDATLNDIKAEINWASMVADAYKGHARFIFYYAGHGFQDEVTRAPYLLPSDGYASDITTGYKLNELYSKFGSFPSESILVLLDACFSGSQRNSEMILSSRGVAIKPKLEMPSGNVVVFAASSGDQSAYPYYEKRHGLFTYYILKKLQDANGDITLGDLGEYVIDKVAKQSVVSNSIVQTPIVISSPTFINWGKLKL